MALNENVVREQEARLSAMVHTPTFLVVAGSLPALYAATSLANGVMIGFVAACAIIVMGLLSPALRAITGVWSRTATMLTVSVTVVVLCGFAVRIMAPVVYESLGIYVPLAAVNALVVARIAGDGISLRSSSSTLSCAMFSATAVFVTLVFVGFINGMFSTGRVFGLTMNELAASPLAVFGTPAGSLLVLALVAVFVQAIEQIPAKAAVVQESDTIAEGDERA